MHLLLLLARRRLYRDECHINIISMCVWLCDIISYFTFSLILFLRSYSTGIPSNQLHLLHNQMELNDSMLLKDIPNFHDKLKLKLVLGMKVGPISSARRVPLGDYDSWFDDVIHQNSK